MADGFSRLFVTSCFFATRVWRFVLVTVVVISFLGSGVNPTPWQTSNACLAQAPPTPQQLAPDLEKAIKYHSALLQRPTPGYLYDRFYNAWLDTSSQEDLLEFLSKRANASSAGVADRLLLAFFYAKQGKDVEALQQFLVAQKSNPDNVAVLYEMAIIQARTLDYESALKNLTIAAHANSSVPEHIKIELLRGKLLARDLKTEAATMVWEELSRNNPEDLDLMEDLIELQVSEGMLKQAEVLSDRLIAKTKDPFQKVIRQLRKGDILQRSGSKSRALELFGNTLIQVGMDTWMEREILSRIEQVFRREDDLIGLSKHLADLAKSNSGRVAIRKSLATILVELGEVDQAIAVYEKIIELTPGSRENREAFTSLLIRARKTDLAVKQIEALIDQHSQDAELQIRLAELCHQISEPEKAAAALHKFISLSGSNEYSYLHAARLFERFEDPDNARDVYKTALEKFQDSHSIKESWADFLFRSGSKNEAVIVWQALAKDTDRAGLVSLVRMISVRKMHLVAFDLLLARYDEFKLDPIYLGQLCNEAIALKKFPDAVEWATERVRLAKTSGEVDAALPNAIVIINAAKATESVVERLRTKQNRGAAETCLLVEMLERLSLNEEAESILQTSFKASKAAKQNQDTLILARQRVRMARKRQDWVAAAKAAQDLIELPGGRKSPNIQQLIELYVRAEDDDLALKWIAEWKRLSPSSLLPWLKEAALLERSGELQESIAVLRRATQVFPDHPELFVRLADKYIDIGQTENAERIFWRMYEDSEAVDDKIRWAQQLAQLADDQGEIDQLVQRFEKRRKNNPQSIEPLLSIAQAHRIAGNDREQREALQKATRLKPDDVSLLLEVARLEESQRDWEEAIQTLKRASKFDKTDETRQRIAQLYFDYGETKKGLAQLLEIAGGENSTAADVEKISQSILKTQNWEELLDFLAPHLARFPNNYRLSFLTAIANEELGNTETAKNQFLILLQADQEILAVAGQNIQPRGRNRSQSKLMRGDLPKSASRLLDMLSEIPPIAYSYRENLQVRQTLYGSASAGLYLPQDLQSCHDYALCHLCDIALDLSPNEQNELQKQLEHSGVENANLLIADVSQTDINENPMALLEIDPDSEAALAIAVLGTVDSEDELPQAFYKKAVRAFKDSYPGLSFLAAVKLDQTEPENQKRLADSVKRLKTIKKLDFSIFFFIAQGTYDIKPLEKYRPELNQLLENWYPELTKSSFNSGWINADWALQSVAISFQQEDSPRRWIDLLDREIDRTKGLPAQQPANANIYSGFSMQQTRGFALPTFPPRELISFPKNIYSLLDLPDLDDIDDLAEFDDLSKADAAEIKSWRDSITTAASYAKDPTLKVLLKMEYFCFHEYVRANSDATLPDSVKAALADQVTDAKSAIDQVLEVSQTNVDVLYLAGALAIHEKRWHDAVADFEALRKLPLSAESRRKIDGHLVALATYGSIKDLDDTKHKEVLKSIKSAALRLNRGTLSQEQRVDLISVFDVLGLDNEAKKLERRIARTGFSSSSMRLGNSGVSRQVAKSVTSIERITKLNNDGKFHVAAQLLSKELIDLARRELDLSLMNSDRYELEVFQSKVVELGLENHLLKQLEPGESANVRKLRAWALAQEVFGKKEIAESAYEKLLEEYPNEQGARLRYLFLNPTGEKQSFALQFPQVNKRFRVQFLTCMFRRSTDLTFDAETLLSLAESIIDYKESDDGESIDDGSMQILLRMLDGEMNVRAKDYKSILPPVNAKVSELPGKFDAIADRKRNLHDRVALLMTDSEVPGQAAKAFTALLASTEAAGKPIDDRIVQLALKTIFPAKRSRAGSQVPQPPLNFYPNWSNGANRGYHFVTKRTPVEFLSRHFGFSKADHDKQVESIATKLESLRAKDVAAGLRTTYALCRCSDDEFVSVVKELIFAAKGPSERPDKWKWKIVLSKVIEVWNERKLKADISPFVFSYAARKTNDRDRTYANNGLPFITNSEPLEDYFQVIASKNDLSEIEGFLTELRLNMIGGEAEQLELSRLLVDQRTIQKNTGKLAPLGTYYRLVTPLTSSHMVRKTFWLGIKERQRFLPPEQEYDVLPGEILVAMKHFKADEADALLEWLRQSSVLNDLSDFDPYYSRTEDTQTSAWAVALKDLGQDYDRRSRVALAKQLSLKADRTFGENLLLAFAEDKPANIDQLFGLEIDKLSALPREKQIKLAGFAKEIKGIVKNQFGKDRAADLPTSKESKAAKQLCWMLEIETVRAEVAKVMKAKRLKDLGVSPEQFEKWAKGFLASVKGLPPEELPAVIAKISKLSTEKDVATQIYPSYMNFSSRMVDDLIGRRVTTDSIKFILAIFEHDDLQHVNLSAPLSRQVFKHFLLQFETAKVHARDLDANLSSTAKSAKAIESMIDQLGDEYGDQNFIVLLPELMGFCSSLSEAEATVVGTWLHSDSEVNAPKIKRAFQLAFDCVNGTQKLNAREVDAERSKSRPIQTELYFKELLDFVDDESYTLQARFRVAMQLLPYETLSAEGVSIFCRVVADGYDAGQGSTDAENAQIFKALIESGNASPGIQNTMVKFAESWIASLKQRQRMFSQTNVVYCLQTLAMTDDKTQVASLLKALDSRADLQIAVTLIESGYFPEAKKQFEINWSQKNFLPSDQFGQVFYTSKLESALPAFIDSLVADDHKYFAELYFSSLKNSPSDQGIESTPESRLNVLADRFAAVEFSSKRERQISLILLAALPDRAKLLDQPLTEEVNDLSVKSLFKDSQSILNARLLGAYFSNQIQLENFETVQAKWKRINLLLETRLANSYRGDAKTALEKLSATIRNSFYELLRDRTPEQIASLLPVLRDLNSPSYQLLPNPNTTQLAHFMAGHTDDLIEYLQEPRVDVRFNGEAPLNTSEDLYDYIDNLNVQIAQIKPTNPQVIKNLVLNIWRFAESQEFDFETAVVPDQRAMGKIGGTGFGSLGALFGSDESNSFFIEQLGDLKILTDKQILEIGPELAEIYSVDGTVWLQLARRQFKAGQHGKAAESYKKSIEQATDEMKTEKLNRRVEYAQTLVTLNRNDEAKVFIKDVPVKELFRANIRTLKKLKKTLDED